MTTDYRIISDVTGGAYIYAAHPLRGMDGQGPPQLGWRNQFWQDTPPWARRVFDDLSEWLAFPRFWNGIVVGEGVGPTRDPDTGVYSYPQRLLPIDANGVGGDTSTTIYNFLGGPTVNPGGVPGGTRTIVANNWSLQSDNYSDAAFPWPGWRLDRSGWAKFDLINANIINSRGTHLHFQFNGATPDSLDRSSVTINNEGALSAPVIITAAIIHNEGGGPLQDLTLNTDVVVHPDGWLDAKRLTVGGVDVSLVGHTHSYLTQAAGDARYSLLAHTHVHATNTSLSADDHPQYHNDSRGDARYAQLSGSPSFTAVTTPSVLHPSGSGSTIAVTGTLDATGLKVGGVSVSLSTHTHAHSSNTSLGADDHTQYHTDGRGDARYSLLAHTHSPSGAGLYSGYKQDTTDGSGEITVTHGKGSTPTAVVVTNTSNGSGGTSSGGPSIGGSGVNAVIHDMDSTTFRVRFHNSTDGSTLSTTNVAFYWHAS